MERSGTRSRSGGGGGLKKTHPVSEQALKFSAMSFHLFNMRDYMTDALFPSRHTAVTCTGYIVPILQCVDMTPAHFLNS